MAVERDPFEVALGALRRKERTVAELGAWLERRGYDPDEVQSGIARLVEAGEVDDERFAQRFAEDKRELSGWGAERIREALLARGIEASQVEAVLAADTHADQVDRASELLLRRGRPLEDDAGRTRALGFLTRRGYEYEIAYEAVRSASARAA